jgi:AcrR family transcriptional regulator
VTGASSDPPTDRAATARARAAQTKRDRTRTALLVAADAAFAARGWARTRVEDIAKAAGVSSVTAYNHFPSKHALVGHVYAPLVRSLRTETTRDIAAGRAVVPALIDQVQRPTRPPPTNDGRPLTATVNHAERVQGRRRARQQASDSPTGSVDCSTSTSRSRAVCGVSGTHRVNRLRHLAGSDATARGDRGANRL